ncbi:MAG: NAD(P)-dependent dehydrogenase (short-subunit alcohol dehydrogenase family) [Arenicella sp.]|jgi:NAD(P)-dependent dehydrogenase (short-subunit alcohol dehydrogenase family)
MEEVQTENKKLALVTGGNRGLGFAWCRQLGKMGFTILLTSRNLEKAQKSAEVLQEEGIEVHAYSLDVTNEESIKETALAVSEKFGKLDLLINNAGINSKSSNNELTFLKNFRLSHLDSQEILKMIHINGIAPTIVAKHFVGLLEKGENPRIVNMSSWLGSVSGKNTGGNYSYATSKASLNMMTRALAYDAQPMGITTVAVNPGWVQTRMGGFSANLSPEESVQRLIDNVVSKLTIEDAGKFFDWDGTEHNW